MSKSLYSRQAIEIPELNYKDEGIYDIITDKSQPINLLIEGDNLMALTCLLETHKEKIDIIYIDPPYNTGKNDFVYNDKFAGGNKNRHSKWLDFMSERLKLAKELLKDEGVIFVSIDDNEQAYLKVLMDSIFGEDNFISCLIWQKKSGGGKAKYFYEGHEYILTYAKNKSLFNGLTVKDGKIEKKKKITINGIEYAYEDDYLRKKYGKYDKSEERRLHYEDIIKYKGEKKKREIDEKIKNKQLILIKDNKTGKHFVAKLFPLSKGKRKKLYSIIKGYWTSDGNNEIRQFGLKFDNPKPKNLLKMLIDTTNNKNAIVLDFFAGSGTTGHAVLELNREDGGNRQFILINNNEVNLKAKENKHIKDYFEKHNIDENDIRYQALGICQSVTYQRLKKAILGYIDKNGKEISGLGGNLKYYRVDEEV